MVHTRLAPAGSYARSRTPALCSSGTDDLDLEWIKFKEASGLDASKRTEAPTDMYLERLRAKGIELPPAGSAPRGHGQWAKVSGLPEGVQPVSAQRIVPQKQEESMSIQLTRKIASTLAAVRVLDAALVLVAGLAVSSVLASAPTSAAMAATHGALDVDDYAAKIEYSWIASCDPRGLPTMAAVEEDEMVEEIEMQAGSPAAPPRRPSAPAWHSTSALQQLRSQASSPARAG